MFDIKYIRYDATHNQQIIVDYQDEPDWLVREDTYQFGLQVLTCNQAIAEILGVDVVSDESVLHNAQLTAISKGEHVFFIEFGSHGSDWFRLTLEKPARDWDSVYCGLIIVPLQAWKKANPRSTYAKRFVYRTLCETFNERVTANLNGWIYEVIINTNDETISWPGYLDPEVALAEAMAEFPEIKYRPEDFEAQTTYTLREKLH